MEAKPHKGTVKVELGFPFEDFIYNGCSHCCAAGPFSLDMSPEILLLSPLCVRVLFGWI